VKNYWWLLTGKAVRPLRGALVHEVQSQEPRSVLSIPARLSTFKFSRGENGFKDEEEETRGETCNGDR
jgi:hypothetical protein